MWCVLQDGLTPLMAAVCGGNAEVVRLLLLHGANLNTITVVRLHNPDIALIIVTYTHGTAVNAQAGVCALHIACELGNSAIVQALLECNPDLTTKDMVNDTAILPSITVS